MFIIYDNEKFRAGLMAIEVTKLVVVLAPLCRMSVEEHR